MGRIPAWLLAAAAIIAGGTPLRGVGQVPTTAPLIASPEQVIQDDVARQQMILLGLDSHPSPDQREQAAERLLGYGGPEAIAVLLRALNSNDGPPAYDIRDAAARALAASEAPPDGQYLDSLATLIHTDPSAAVAALSRYATTDQASRAVTTLAGAAADNQNNKGARAVAAGGLGAFATRPSAEALVDMLNHSEIEEVRTSAADALMNMTGLQENGHDAARWNAWWQTAANQPAQQWARAVPLAARSAELNHAQDELVERVSRLLQEVYPQTTDPKLQEAMLLGWLRDAQPSFRVAAVRIVISQTQRGGRALSREVSDQVRSMVADRSSEVRRYVVIALIDTNDVDALPRILAQLTIETDPDVKREMASALGKFHPLAGVDPLLRLLNDPNVRVQTAAADALRGEMAQTVRKDPNALAAVTNALSALLDSASASQNSSLRGSLLGAAAPLRDPLFLHQFSIALADNNNPSSVRIAAAQGLGNLTGVAEREQATRQLQDAMGDNDKVVRLAAVLEIKKVGTFARVREPLRYRVLHDNDYSVRDAAWQSFLSLAEAPEVSASEDLIPQIDATARDDTNRRIQLYELIIAKLQKDVNNNVAVATLLAKEQQNVGDEYKKLKQWDKAADHYGAALTLWQDPKMTPAGQTIPSLSESLERMYLRGGKYALAVTFAGGRIAQGGEEEDHMGSAIRDEIHDLTIARKYKEALELSDQALNRMEPKFSDLWKATLKQEEEEARARASSQGMDGAKSGVAAVPDR